jgi:predicted aldo/keto reductase-like oxidoreductase
VDTAIVCMTNHDQLDMNLLAMAGPFTGKDDALLSEQLAFIGPTYCRMCGACNGMCEKGVPVPDMLRIVTYADGYRDFALARERFLELPEEARAIRCGDCTSCSVHCPNGVQIRERLTLAQSMLA